MTENLKPTCVISPMDEGRYGSPEVRRIFERRSRYAIWLRVEAALARAQADAGLVPRWAAEEISRRARHEPPVAEVDELERETGHELAALIRVFASQCGDAGRFVHFGATSSDIIDTALAIQLKDATSLLCNRLAALMEVTAQLAERTSEDIAIGRTHGQHALPITIGFRVAGWLDAVLRHALRLDEMRPRLLVGKLSGAVGSYAAFGGKGRTVEARALADLGVNAGLIASQVVHRDRLAEFVCWAASLGSCLEKIATDVRNLQRPEIGEVSESFAEGVQVGSSTMAQKRNPVRAEKICGLSRLIRGFVIPALESVSLWEERDLTNSCVERVTAPMAVILLDESLLTTRTVVESLEVHRARSQRNLALTSGRSMAEVVLLRLVERGMDRWEAYRAVQAAAHVPGDGEDAFHKALLDSEVVRRHVGAEDVDALLDPYRYLGVCVELVVDVVNETRAYLSTHADLR